MTAPTRVVDWPLSVEPYWHRVPGAVPLLHAIAEEPDDDGAYLVLADLCDDVGESARAEFVRAQVRPSLLGVDEDDAAERAAELFASHGVIWTEGLPAIPDATWDAACFARGLLCAFTLDRTPTDDEAAAIFAAADIRSFALNGDEPVGEMTRALFDRLTDLSIEGVPDDISFLSELRRSNLRSLGFLGLNYRFSVADVVASPGLANLVSLVVGECEVTGKDIDSLAASETLRNLESLTLTDCEWRSAAVERLAAWDGLRRLRRLGLGYNRFTNDEVASLANSPHLGGLERLDLTRNRLGRTAADVLANGPALANVREIALAANDIGAAYPGLLGRALFDGRIVLEHNPVGDDGIAHVLRGWDERPCRSLLLRGIGVGREGMRRLAAHPGLSNVRAIDLADDDIGAAGFATLLESPHLQQLTTFLGRNLGLDGRENVRPRRWLPRLRSLQLSREKS